MGSGSPTCPLTPPSFSPPSTCGLSSTSRSPTSPSRPAPISNAPSQSAASFSMAISSASGQTSTGGPSRPSRANQPDSVSPARKIGSHLRGRNVGSLTTSSSMICSSGFLRLLDQLLQGGSRYLALIRQINGGFALAREIRVRKVLRLVGGEDLQREVFGKSPDHAT